MNKRLIILSFFIIMCLGIFLPNVSALYSIPPTNAYQKIITSNGTVNAKKYNEGVTFQGNANVTITGSDHSKTIFFNVKGGNGKNGTNGTNGTTITPLTCALNNQVHGITVAGTVATIHCAVNNSTGITSINGNTGTAQTLQGTTGNITVTDSGSTHTWNIGNLVVIINGAAQTITKALTLVSLILGGNANGGGFSFINLNYVNATKFFQNGNQVIDTLVQGSGISITGSGNTRTITNTGILNAITSINSQTGPAITISNGPSSNNVKITTTTNKIQIDSNNTSQVTNLLSPNGYGYKIQITRTNSTNNNIKSIACQNINCSNNSTNITIGPVVLAPSPDYVITINSTNGLFQEYSGKNNTILFTSQNATDAGLAVQDAWNNVNRTAGLGKSGWIDVDCGTFPIQHALQFPMNGNLTMTGHGRGCTAFTIPSQSPATKNNNFAEYKGTHSVTAFRNFFAHFSVFSNSNAGKNTAWLLSGTGPNGNGIVDTTWFDVDIENFGQDLFYLGTNNQADNVIDASILEKAGRAELYLNAGQKLRVIDSKLILNNGKAAVIFNGSSADQFTSNLFSLNQYSDIYVDNASKNNQVKANQFESCSQAGSGKTDCIGIAYGQSDQFNDNNFNAPNAIYDINFYGNGTSSTTGMQVKNNIVSSHATKGFINYASASKSYGQLKNNDVSGNFDSVTQYSLPMPNCFNAVTDPSKSACFFGMQNSNTRNHYYNFTVPNSNGTLALVPGSNSTTNNTAQTFAGASAFVMQNSPIFIKTKVTGNVFVSFDISVSDNTINGGCDIEIQYGTGTAPKTGATLTGTTIGLNETFSSPTINAKGVIPIQYPASGLVNGTSYWIEPAVVVSGAGGTCTLRSEMEYVTER